MIKLRLLFALTLSLLSAFSNAATGDRYSSVTYLAKSGFGKDPATACMNLASNLIGVSGAPYTFAKAVDHPSVVGAGSCYLRRFNSTNDSMVAPIQVGYCPADRPFFRGQSCLATDTPPPPQEKCDVPAGSKITWYGKTGTGSMDSEHSDVAGFPKSSPSCYLTGIADVNSCYRYEIAGPKYQYACKFEGTSNGEPVAWGQGPELAEPPTSGQPPVTTPPFQAPDDKTCPKGTVNAGLSASGIPMCIGQGTDPKNTPAAPPKVEVEKNEVMPDGSTQNTKSVTTKNADGSTTTVKTVTVTKSTGEKETTQEKNTTQTPTGKPGKETENPVTESPNVCKQNPNLAMCKNSTVGGKCGETSCTGDAIQCATLRAAAILQCKAEKDELDLKASPLAAKGQSAMDGGDMEGLPGPKNGLVVNVNSMKTEGWLGNGAAFDDITVSIRGQQVVVPLSKWSQYLLPFRYMLMIIAGLISFRILAGAVLKE